MKIFYLLIILFLSLTSCVSIPEDYQNEIDDAVRFYVSAADFLAHHENTEESKMFIDEIIIEKLPKRRTNTIEIVE